MTPISAAKYREAVERQRSCVVELPWPDKRLSPNARVHWATKRPITKMARELAYWTVAADHDPLPGSAVHATLTFHAHDKRKRDLDNAFASCKPYIDGLVDFLGIDDAFWDFTIKRGEPRKGGAVVIEMVAK